MIEDLSHSIIARHFTPYCPIRLHKREKAICSLLLIFQEIFLTSSTVYESTAANSRAFSHKERPRPLAELSSPGG